jgi:GxxExxY protein
VFLAGTTTDLERDEKMVKLIHSELSYQVRGVLFDVYNSLGPMLKEEYYRDAIIIGLEKRGVVCEAEEMFEVYYGDERVGLYFVDVWIEEGKVLLELKVAPVIEPIHKAQAISYLKVTDADLAIVVNYGGPSLEDGRLPNFVRDKEPEFVWESRPVAEGLLYPDLTNDVQRVCSRVHFVLGPGFLHQVYRRATMIELRRSGLDYDYIKQLPVEYKGHLLGHQDVRLILVKDKVLLATFALRRTNDTLVEQLKAHLRRLGLELGLLANFHGTRMAITPVRMRQQRIQN